MIAAGYQGSVRERVVSLAKLTQESDLDGVVCSSHEIEAIREACGSDFALMVPGIRPAGSDTNDQKRIMTPKDALDKGANHLVIGRPITKADNPAEAVKEIISSL
ncbi:MAG: orotidine 5'-phosphate decarboxylase / HUMPS family protein [Pseudomonadota bacterium]